MTVHLHNPHAGHESLQARVRAAWPSLSAGDERHRDERDGVHLMLNNACVHVEDIFLQAYRAQIDVVLMPRSRMQKQREMPNALTADASDATE
eukprot:CAMPEP_0206036742 /NCGR_PEP_ID=MMETSP1466-20131121/2987_1 /ASSEMBLY_ACC=CAM_ASM_001126 /TAXON_ID=44452 /ORGANISM="Pavlova gyrans, Strain CCMP608" /LENGTH=92 /DNA_ID=CAMNT_0053411245 /DNA_START=46 /DNA_END=322 /DNA_ORIENTATION=-